MKKLGPPIGMVLGGAFLGWFTASLILFAIFAMLSSFDRHPMAYQGPAMALVIIFGALPTTLVAAATLGLGWHTIALARRRTTRSDYWLPGALIGAVVAFVMPFITLPGIGADWLPLILVGTFYGAACGGFTGLYAWLIRRPDHDAPANPASTGS